MALIGAPAIRRGSHGKQSSSLCVGLGRDRTRAAAEERAERRNIQLSAPMLPQAQHILVLRASLVPLGPRQLKETEKEAALELNRAAHPKPESLVFLLQLTVTSSDFHYRSRVDCKMGRRSIFRCAFEKKRWPNGKGTKEREVDLHTGRLEEPVSFHSVLAVRTLPRPGGFRLLQLGILIHSFTFARS